MLNPLTAWTPGLLVTYHGSLTTLHGLYEAHPCGCLNCTDRHGLPGVRFELRDEHGNVSITCVRPRSITSADVDEPAHEECLGIHNGADGYRDCDGNPI
ncbi:hypothetical protein [Streptomyces ossamyceticus]|uniref:hypothetical protein n=1 Tax=Streptomyces ossamyceticus TaxID=249581 RepID=UPI00344AA6B4